MSHTAAPHPMTLDRERTALVVIDVQERLFPAMDADHREEVQRHDRERPVREVRTIVRRRPVAVHHEKRSCVLATGSGARHVELTA